MRTPWDILMWNVPGLSSVCCPMANAHDCIVLHVVASGGSAIRTLDGQAGPYRGRGFQLTDRALCCHNSETIQQSR
jgi:hypothetical protein